MIQMESEKVNDFEKKKSDAIISVKGDTDTFLTEKFNVFAFITFALVGCVQLIGWNAVLNFLNEVTDKMFEDPGAAVGIRVTYCGVLLATTALFIKVNVVSRLTVYIGIGLTTISAIIIGITSQTATGGAGVGLYHGIAILLAFASGAVGSAGYGYAGQFPIDYSGAVSAGLGLSGVLTFVVWAVCHLGVFSKSTVNDNVVFSVWSVAIAMIIVSVCASVMFYLLFQKQWVLDWFNKTDANNPINNSLDDFSTTESTTKLTPVEDTYKEGGLRLLFSRTWMMGLTIFSCLFLTLFCFPEFIPVHSTTGSSITILIGTYQVGDVIGRYFPNVFSALMLKPKTCQAFVFLRFIFVIISILTVKLTGSAFLQHFSVQFIIVLTLALSNGWLCTVTFLRILEFVNGGEAKARVAAFALLCTIGGIFAGQFAGLGIIKLVI